MWVRKIYGNRGERVIMKKRSKRYREILKLVKKDKKIDTKEIFELVKKNSTSKFDESINVSFRTDF